MNEKHIVIIVVLFPILLAFTIYFMALGLGSVVDCQPVCNKIGFDVGNANVKCDCKKLESACIIPFDGSGLWKDNCKITCEYLRADSYIVERDNKFNPDCEAVCICHKEVIP
jgi:hypothetical protein